MGIAIDQLTLGDSAIGATATTIPFTTTGAVASGGFISISVAWFSTTVTLSSITGGSLTWTIDKQVASAPQGVSVALCSAQAPSGLASSTTLTANFSATTAGRAIAGTSFTGVATSSPVDVLGTNSDTANVTAWTTGSITIADGSVLIGNSYGHSLGTTSTVTSPSIEAHDYGNAASLGCTTCYRIEATGGSFTVAGAWTVAQHGTTLGVAYKAAPSSLLPRSGDVTLQAVNRGASF